MSEMRGLSVRYPWSFAIAKGFKPVENRTRPIPAKYVGIPVALHASLTMDAVPSLPTREATRALALAESDAALSLGAVIAMVRFGSSHRWLEGDCRYDRACSVWAEMEHGVHHWPVEVIAALRHPVEAKGMLGLWRLPDEVEKAVREQLEEG
jgi:hypothetical protein